MRHTLDLESLGAGTFVGLPRTPAPEIMRICETERLLAGRPGSPRGLMRSTGCTNDPRSAPAYLYGHAQSVLAGMRPKSSGFLLPYWVGFPSSVLYTSALTS